MRTRRVTSITDVVSHHLCVSCGACVLADPIGIEWRFDRRQAIYAPHVTTPPSRSAAAEALAVCPGKGLELLRLANTIRSPYARYDGDLGFVLEAYAVRSLVPRILENASSGGIITATAHHLLSTGQVTGVVATSLAYGPDGPRPRSMIARDIETLLACQGSKYCPVSIHEAIEPLRHRGERIAFIGTPCQIAAVRMLMEQADWLRSAVRFVIGSFCGGMKSYKEMDALIRRQGVQPAEVVRFAFRGGGQPGRMTIEDVHGKKCERPYPDYVTDTGYRKLDRCRLCVDGTAELADLASGDAWLPRFMKSGKTWSIAIARNEDAARLLREMKEKGILEVQPISQDEIRHSQRSNLSSKKKRMTARRRLYRILGRPTPVYDGGFPVADTGLGFELRVHLRHAALSWLERVRLYWPFIRCARWIRGTNECRRSGPPARTEGP